MPLSPFQNRNILIVDKDRYSRDLLRKIVNDASGVGQTGPNVFMADNGITALQKIAAAPTSVDAILLDMEMPGMGGLAVLKALRANPEKHIRQIPVVLITAEGNRDRMETGIRVGVHGFLVKPPSPASVIKLIKRALTGEPVKQLNES